MEGIGAEVSQKVKSAIKAKLVELGVYVDEELPDYIMVMVANKRTKSEMVEDLQLFLGPFTDKFISWLLQVLQKLHEVTVASQDAKRASSALSTDKDKEKIIKKKKLPSTEAEPESVKKNRKKKIETEKKDIIGKKIKKSNNLKKKIAKPDAVKVTEKRPIDKAELPVKEKKDQVEKPKESSIEKSIPLNLPTTSRSNPKPVLMVSDEDDEDFINIRADAEADLLVSELQEEVRPIPPPQKNVAQVLPSKSSDITSQRMSDKLTSSSQESSGLTRALITTREPIVSTHKDNRLHHADDDSYVMHKTHLESVAQISKPTILKRTQVITSVADTYHKSAERQAKCDEDKEIEVQRVQPTSKITLVSRVGSIKSRLGKRPFKEDSPPRSDRMKPKGVPSVVKVKGRPKVPLSAQANKNLILKAVAEAQKSVASSLIRSDYVFKSHGLLTKKNRGDFSKIAITLPNPRITSIAQPVRRMQDQGENDPLMHGPALLRNMPDSHQSYSRSMHSSLASSNELPSMRNLPPFGDIVSANDRTSGHSLLSRGEMSPMSDLPSMNNMISMSSHASLRSLPSMADEAPLSDLPVLHEQASIHDLPTVHDLSPVRDLPSVHSLPSIHGLPAMDLQEPTLNIAQPSQSLPQSFQSQSQMLHSRQLIRSQSQRIASNLQQSQNRPKIVEVQPQPDIVAGLHEAQSIVCRVSRSTIERLTMTECADSPADASQIRPTVDNLSADIEFQNSDPTTDLENVSYQEVNCICPEIQEDSVEMQEKPVSPTMDSPPPMRPCSPQFFVTLNGYDPRVQNGRGRVVRSNLSEKSRRFLVPESEEMVEGQEFMDEGIGEEEFKQEAVNGNDAEMIDDELEKDIQTLGPVPFRKINQEPSVEDGDASMKIKSSERCRFWPACRLGERCEFHHPTIPCKSFPICKFGDKCLYIHPNCKFDASCTRKDCPFTHAIPRSLVIAPVPAPIRVPTRPSQIQCRFFPKCTNVNCKFFHPKPCRFGKACNKYDCPFMHDREQLPPKDKLKWVCPGKA